MQKRIVFTSFLLALILSGGRIMAQQQLEDYIKFGLDHNEGIRQQGFEMEKSLYLLKEAKSLFLPTVNFNTTYTKADGGRTINFPSGDLLNGVYSSLNQLTGSNKFPQLQNQSVLLNPDNFYDARFRTSLPLINAELIYNKRIARDQVELQKLQVNLYKRELVMEIKRAYYDYAKASNAIGIYESALKLVEENKRINTALYDNQKINKTSVMRSDNEVIKINSRLTTAKETLNSAKEYFNFLLNRPLSEEIVAAPISEIPTESGLSDTSVSKREELAKLKLALSVNDNITRSYKSYLIPKLNTFMDLGSQAFDWKFNDKSRYYLFGVSLDWNVFASGRNTYHIRQAEAEQKSLQSQNDYTQQQLAMQLSVSKNNYRSSLSEYGSSTAQLKTAERYYNDILLLYKQGQALFIEVLDGQNQLVDARLNANISLYNAWIRYAEIERANASFNLNN